MNLLIGDNVKEKIEQCSLKWTARPPEDLGLKISILMKHFSINFFQPERYVRLISCYFDFGEDIGFFFEDVCRAVEKSNCSKRVDVARTNDDVYIRRINEDYVLKVLHFCEQHIDQLAMVPPWFEKAVAISDEFMRKNFPEMADDDLRKARLLLESWRNQPSKE